MIVEVPSTRLNDPSKMRFTIKLGKAIADLKTLDNKGAILIALKKTIPQVFLNNCSMCGRGFFSVIPGNRQCDRCKKEKKKWKCRICGSSDHTTANCPKKKCAYCGEKVSLFEYFRSKRRGDGTIVCNQCQGFCKICGKKFIKSFFWQEHCPSCKTVKVDPKTRILAQNIVAGGGTNSLTKMWNPFSLEIEVYALGEDAFNKDITTKTIRRGTDSSIKDYGFGTAEFRLGPYYGDYGLELLHNDVAKIRQAGWRADESCGLHMHVDASEEEKNFNNLTALFFQHQKALYSLTNWKRYKNKYCAPLESSKYESESSRRQGLNCTAYKKHNTIEYRFLAGCTNPMRVYRWAKLLLNFTKIGFSYNPMSPISIAEIMGSDIEYWKEIYKIQAAIAKKAGETPIHDGNFSIVPPVPVINFRDSLKIESMEDLKAIKAKIKEIEAEIKEEAKFIFTFETRD